MSLLTNGSSFTMAMEAHSPTRWDSAHLYKSSERMLAGGYGSDSEGEEPALAAEQPKSEKAPLPLPAIMIKREATVEAPSLVKQEEPPPWKEEEEQVDYSDASEDSSS